MTRSLPIVAVWTLIALLIGGALVLTADRGGAILLDLAAMTRGFLCF